MWVCSDSTLACVGLTGLNGSAVQGVKLLRVKLGHTILGSIYSLLTNQRPQSLEEINKSLLTQHSLPTSMRRDYRPPGKAV